LLSLSTESANRPGMKLQLMMYHWVT